MDQTELTENAEAQSPSDAEPNVSSEQTPEALSKADDSTEVASEQSVVKEADVTQEVEKPAEKKDQSYFDKRINKITAGSVAHKQRADSLEAKVRDLESKLTDNSSQNNAVEFVREPKIEDFDYDEGKLADALSQYRADEVKRDDARVDARVDARMSSLEAKTKAGELMSATKSKIDTFKASVPDFDQKMANWVNLPDDTFSSIAKCDKSAEVIYHLASNPDIAFDLSQLSPIDAAIKIGQLTSTFSDKKIESGTYKAKPSPIQAISGSTKGVKEVSEMSPDELDNIDFD